MRPNVRPAAWRRKSGWLLLTLLAVACRGRAGDATLFVADRVIPGAPGASVVLVREGRIVATGDSTLASDPRASGARLVAWPGATVTPPLVDHHVHLFNVGLTLLNDRDGERLFLDLSRARSLREAQERVRTRAAQQPPGSWIIGSGWNEVAWGMDALPDRSALDAAAPDHPVFLGRSDGHAGWANLRALTLAGIGRETPDPPGGKIGRYPDGTPNGVLLERAKRAGVRQGAGTRRQRRGHRVAPRRLGSRGGALTHPYRDDPTTVGVPRMSVDEIVAIATRALDAGLGVATHAIGDEAVRRALDAYERLLATHRGLDPRRLRIEHFSYAREPDLVRAVRLGIVLSVQGNFNAAPTDSPTFGALRVGADSEARVYPWRRLHEMGALLAEGRPVPRPGHGHPLVSLRRGAHDSRLRPRGASQLPGLAGGSGAGPTGGPGHPRSARRRGQRRGDAAALRSGGNSCRPSYYLTGPKSFSWKGLALPRAPVGMIGRRGGFDRFA